MSQVDYAFEATIVENADGTEHKITTQVPESIITGSQFEVVGQVPPSLRLVAIYIRDKSGPITAKRYDFPNNDNPDRPAYGGHYHPDREENSWIGTAGHIQITEYDSKNKRAKGVFEFTAVWEGDPKKTAEIKGRFNLGNTPPTQTS